MSHEWFDAEAADTGWSPATIVGKPALLTYLQEQARQFCLELLWNGRPISLAEAMVRARALPEDAHVSLTQGGVVEGEASDR